jgi:hypothetical protein
MILTLGKKCLRLQTKFREGTKQVDAFDFKETFFLSDNELREIEIGAGGYIFKPNQVYLFQIDDGRFNHDSFFNPDLKMIGVRYAKINELQYSLQFTFPVKLYEDSSIFIQ